jgi:hypothetical protein
MTSQVGSEAAQMLDFLNRNLLAKAASTDPAEYGRAIGS